MSPGRAALSVHTLAAAERIGGRGQRPETPAGALGSANAADDGANTLTCVSLPLCGPSSPGAPKLCGRPWVRAVAGLRLCDTHMQQATTVMQCPASLLRIWILQLYGKMPCPRIKQYSSLSTRSESYASVFEIPLGYIDPCHGSVNYPANSSYHRLTVRPNLEVNPRLR